MKEIEIRNHNRKALAVSEKNLTDCEFNYKEKIIGKLKKFAEEVGETDGVIYVEFDDKEIKNVWFNDAMITTAQIEVQKALGFIK